ncbi:hypothetical protein [Roseovarius sp.]|uniref:hypothetical protein n=1 Tax=Roseovarius sp. TaxID=1486281 RepID=UPI003B5A8FB9
MQTSAKDHIGTINFYGLSGKFLSCVGHRQPDQKRLLSCPKPLRAASRTIVASLSAIAALNFVAHVVFLFQPTLMVHRQKKKTRQTTLPPSVA